MPPALSLILASPQLREDAIRAAACRDLASLAGIANVAEGRPLATPRKLRELWPLLDALQALL